MLLCDSTSSHHLFTRNIIFPSIHNSAIRTVYLCISILDIDVVFFFYLIDFYKCWLIRYIPTLSVFEKGEWRYELDLCKSQHSKMRKFMWYEYRILISETWTSKTVTFIFYENKSRKFFFFKVFALWISFYLYSLLLNYSSCIFASHIKCHVNNWCILNGDFEIL